MPRLGKKRVIETDVYTLAKERIHRAYDRFDTIAVMFSGGKDSTACLNLVVEVARERGVTNVPVHHFDEEAIPYETEQYVRRSIEIPEVDMHWWCIPIRHRNACSTKHPWWFPWAPEDRDKWVRPLPPEAITELEGYPEDPEKRLTVPQINGLIFDPLKHGNVGIVMGIRADESLTRTRAILNSQSREDTHIIKFDEGTAQGNIYKVYPVYDWNTQDIWTAPKKYGWDWNTAYDVMDKAGIKPNDQRCAPPYGEEPMRGLHQFKECFPDIWPRMQTRVVGANTAAKYATTVLYSHNQNPKKPDNMEWTDFIKFWINKHPEPYRGMVAKRVSDWIKNHYQKTQDPILEKIAHPLTGMSWQFLLKIAVRGDFKDRKQPQFAKDEQDFLDKRRRYNEERHR